jgi:methylated-DNA-[protein]-cysteine S-methyltransferase
MTLYTYFQSPCGKMLLLSDVRVLTGLYFMDQKYAPVLDSRWRQDSTLDVFLKTQTQLLEYLAGTRQLFDVAYRFKCGTPFQQKIWNAILTIPYGKTLSYKSLAEHLELPKSVRAVATAVGRNPVLLIVPCHRIIGSNGSLVGYAGGLERKNELLALERKYLVN